MDCLDNIIGLSETTCPCFEDGKPSDANVSASGVFLDRLDNFNLKVADMASDCGKGSFWERAAQAVEDAKITLKKDLLGCIGATYKPRNQLFSGQIGTADFKSVQNLSESHAGLKICPSQLRGAFIYLKRIGIIVNASVPVTVDVYSSEGYDETKNGTLIASYTTPGNVTANTLTWLALSTPLELPMFSNNCKIEYFVVFRFDGSYKTVDNKVDCGCGGVKRPWLSWLHVHGTKGNDVTKIRSFVSTDKFFNGMVLDLEVKCKTEELICNAERPLDFENDIYAQYLAYAVRFRAASKLYADLASTDNINRQVLLDREELANYSKQWISDYNACVQYLCSITNIDNNDCLVCRDTTTFTKRGVLI